MSVTVQSTGDIESICPQQQLRAGETAELVFRSWDDVTPPLTIKIRSPSGKTILDRVLRELPTGQPQSPPPVNFPVKVAGQYRIVIRELYGKAEGKATLTIG